MHEHGYYGGGTPHKGSRPRIKGTLSVGSGSVSRTLRDVRTENERILSTHRNVVLEVLQDRLALQLLRGRQEAILRRPLEVGQDDGLQSLQTSHAMSGCDRKRAGTPEVTRLERLQLGLLARRVQLGEDAFQDAVVLAHFGRPVEVVDVLPRAEEVRLGLEQLAEVVLVRDDDLYAAHGIGISFTRGVRQQYTGRVRTAIGLDAFGSACTAMLRTRLQDL